MSIDRIQLEEVIIRPSLNAIGLCSDDAVKLLLATAGQESELGKYLVQQGMTDFKGGIGIYQMQSLSYQYIWSRHVESSVSMKSKIRIFLGYDGQPQASRMASDLSLATIMARLFYANILEKLPDHNDIKAMYRYYKLYWNTRDGKATEEEFITSYDKFVL